MSMKALLLISTIGGGLDGGYEVEMPSMTECLDARVAIMEQVKDAAVAETDKMEKFFGIFMEIVERMREMENERLNAEANR
jgi:uncharacterized protein (DUF2384 family)